MSSSVLNAYLTFGGNAREAMEFYQQVLGGTLDVQTFADFGAPVSEGYQNNVMHARLDGDGLTLMGSDSEEGSSPVVGSNISLSLMSGAEGHDRLSAAFAALSEGGSVTMALSEAPWGATFGMLTDKFGISWLVNIEKAGS